MMSMHISAITHSDQCKNWLLAGDSKKELKAIPLEVINIEKEKSDISISFERFHSSTSARRDFKNKASFINVLDNLQILDDAVVKAGIARGLGAYVENIIMGWHDSKVGLKWTDGSFYRNDNRRKPISNKSSMASLVMLLRDDYVFHLGKELRKFFVGSPINVNAIVGTSFFNCLGTINYCGENGLFNENQGKATVLSFDKNMRGQMISLLFSDNITRVLAYHSVDANKADLLARNDDIDNGELILFLDRSFKKIPEIVQTIANRFAHSKNHYFESDDQFKKAGLRFFNQFFENNAENVKIEISPYPQCYVSLQDFSNNTLYDFHNMIHLNNDILLALKNPSGLSECQCVFNAYDDLMQPIALEKFPVRIPAGEQFVIKISQDPVASEQPEINVHFFDKSGIEKKVVRYSLPRYFY